MAHDFFTPQTVKGSRIYYIKSALHNRTDEKAIAILRNITSGMKPGYSKLWVLDGILPETNAPQGVVLMDIMMVVMLDASERTKAQWHTLLKKDGLQIIGIDVRQDGFGLIEAILPGAE
jgi:hypothetical protein